MQEARWTIATKGRDMGVVACVCVLGVGFLPVGQTRRRYRHARVAGGGAQAQGPRPEERWLAGGSDRGERGRGSL